MYFILFLVAVSTLVFQIGASGSKRSSITATISALCAFALLPGIGGEYLLLGCSSQSSTSSNTTEVKENGQIPGFSSCLKTDTWSDDPNENISYCCKQVGGTLRDGIMMKTCEK